ncbi:MAG: tripartite tricarboxylate transporter substrate binding protein [Burkholderiales bacterium]|nr:tripartite tricarboxylate transporter substrate binding protein [Burkholderiales bacterium]
MNRRDLLSLALMSPIPVIVHANDYPTAPINIITPLAPGDAADSTVRLMAQELSTLLGVAVTIGNRPGAGGSIGTEAVIRAPKDGYTVLYAQNSPLTIRRVLDPETAAYDPAKDLTPLALTTRTPSILVARTNASFKNFKEMVEQSLRNPNSINIGNAGPGSAGDISVQLINSIAKTSIRSVNYKGAAPAISDVLGGHIEAVVLALGAVSSHMRAGTLRGLAISSRFPEFPDVPTLGQLGYPQELQGVWFAFFMPAGVPTAVADKFTRALEKVARDPAIGGKLEQMGIVQEWSSDAQLVAEMQREYSTMQGLIRRNVKQ